MLKPKQIEDLPNTLIELYSQVEMDIIADMAARISSMDYFIPAAQWQYRKLLEMGNCHGWIMQALSAHTGKTRIELEQLMRDAGFKAIRQDSAIYKRAGLHPPELAASQSLQAVLNDGIRNTAGLFENLSRTTANTATKQFERALDRTWLQIQSGAFSIEQAVRFAVKDLAQKGVECIAYPSGRVDHMDVAVRRAVVTGANQTALRMQDSLAEEMDCDLVETTAHAGARPEHAVWQGQVFSRSGTHPRYPDFRMATGYGTGAGLGGWNCRHSFFPYFEGLSEPAYTPEELEGMSAPRYTYNGEKLTEYEASQKQRSIERNIRRWKREYKAVEAAGLDTAEASARLSQWYETQRDFIAQTGLKRQFGRERVEGFGRSEAAKTKAVAIKSQSGYNGDEKRGVPVDREELFQKIDDTPVYSPEYKARMKETYDYFRKEGYLFREHALNRFLGQKSGRGKTSFTREDLLGVLKRPTNYLQEDGKAVRYYGSIAVFSAPDTQEIVGIVVRAKPKTDWREKNAEE